MSFVVGLGEPSVILVLKINPTSNSNFSYQIIPNIISGFT